MRIVMTLLVRDEEDILEANLRLHDDAGVDFFIVTDNCSVDATPQILQEWVDRGRAHVIREDDDDYAQATWVTRMARLAATEFGADWVINADADELFIPTSGTLHDVLAAVSAETGQLRVPRLDFPTTQESEMLVADGLPFWRALQVREVRSLSSGNVPLPPKVIHRAHPQASVAQGNHAVYEIPWSAPQELFRPISIAHFPKRSWVQFERKIRLGGAAYARNTSLGPDVGATWRQLYQDLADGVLHDRYCEELLTEQAIEAGIGGGTLVLDRRVATRLDRLMHGPVAGEPQIQQLQRLERVGAVVDYDDLLRDPSLLQSWGAAFAADDPVTLVVHAPGRRDDQIAAELVPLVEAAGMMDSSAADVLVAATERGALNRSAVHCYLAARYVAHDEAAEASAPADALDLPSRVLTPGTRVEMRRALLGLS